MSDFKTSQFRGFSRVAVSNDVNRSAGVRSVMQKLAALAAPKRDIDDRVERRLRDLSAESRVEPTILSLRSRSVFAPSEDTHLPSMRARMQGRSDRDILRENLRDIASGRSTDIQRFVTLEERSVSIPECGHDEPSIPSIS